MEDGRLARPHHRLSKSLSSMNLLFSFKEGRQKVVCEISYYRPEWDA
jgi:hypothetical protein